MEWNISMESIFKKRKSYEKNEDDSAQPLSKIAADWKF